MIVVDFEFWMMYVGHASLISMGKEGKVTVIEEQLYDASFLGVIYII